MAMTGVDDSSLLVDSVTGCTKRQGTACQLHSIAATAPKTVKSWHKVKQFVQHDADQNCCRPISADNTSYRRNSLSDGF